MPAETRTQTTYVVECPEHPDLATTTNSLRAAQLAVEYHNEKFHPHIEARGG